MEQEIKNPRLLISKTALANRHQKRQYLQDAQVLMPDLIGVELRFAESVFETSDEVSYRELYRFYLDQFTTTCKMMKAFKHKHLRHTAINEEYFALVYAPREGREND